MDILNLLHTACQHYGFEIDVCSDGHEALERYVHSVKQYSLVILDLKLNSIGGETIYKSIKEVNPDSKVCIFTASNFRSTSFQGILSFISR